MSWFDDLSPSAKKAYLAKHPNSKYGKKTVKKKQTGKNSSTTRTVSKLEKSSRRKKAIREEIAFEKAELKRHVEWLKKNKNRKLAPLKIAHVKGTMDRIRKVIKNLSAKLSKIK